MLLIFYFSSFLPQKVKKGKGKGKGKTSKSKTTSQAEVNPAVVTNQVINPADHYEDEVKCIIYKIIPPSDIIQIVLMGH